MSVLVNLRNNEIVISRMTALSSGKNYLSTVTSGIPCTIQKLSIEKTEIARGTFGKTYNLYCDASVDIQEGDKIKDEDGVLYKVKAGGVTKEEMGTIVFYKVMVEQVT